MQESSAKFCPSCGAQNNLSDQLCQKCGARCSGAPPLPVAPARQKQKFPPELLIVCAGAIIGVCGLMTLISGRRTNEAPSSGRAELTASPSPIPTSPLNLPGDEKQSRTAPINGMPQYEQVSDAARKLGFQLGAFKDNGDSTFMAEATRFIGGREFRCVVMGPDGDRVDTIRIQAWGFQTKQARQRLERWVTQVLSSLNRGQLPGDFIRQLYAGATVGDDGVSNCFCNVQVLQKPITLGRPSASDRITIDLIFDKTDRFMSPNYTITRPAWSSFGERSLTAREFKNNAPEKDSANAIHV